MQKTNHFIRNIALNNIYKYITLFIFLLLPKRVSVIFANLSILSIILSIQKRKINLEKSDVKKLEKLLNVSFCEEILLFPNYTLDWFWNKEFLEQDIVIHDKKVKLYEAVTYEELFNHYTRTIVGVFIDNLPGILKFKLNLSNTAEKIYLKHSIMRTLLYI